MATRTKRSLWIHLSALLVAVTAALMPALVFGEGADDECENPRHGVCWDHPSEVGDRLEMEISPIIFVWCEEPVGSGCYCLYQLVRWFRVLKYPLINGQGDVQVRQLAWLEWRKVKDASGEVTYKPADGGTAPYSNNPDCYNVPAGPGQPPPTYPIGAAESNCHGAAMPPVNMPSNPPPTPPPGRPGSVGTPAPNPSTGAVINGDEAEKVISKSGCFEAIECSPPASHPPSGTILMIYTAPKKPDGEPDHGKATPQHSFTSNGDGTYDSKDGPSGAVDDGSYDDAVGDYLDPPDDSNQCSYLLCYRNTCD